MLPRNKIKLLEILSQWQAQNFIVTHTARRGAQTPPPPASEKDAAGLQRESCLERVKSDRAPQEEKGLEGEKGVHFPKGT